LKVLGIFEAKKNFSALVDAVEAGEEVRITRHGREVVRLLPVKRQPVITARQVERELAGLAQLHKKIKPGPDWRALRDEGRE
jgi:prevent-host-death family protein